VTIGKALNLGALVFAELSVILLAATARTSQALRHDIERRIHLIQPTQDHYPSQLKKL
jgi:hypothetical protein